MNLDASINPAEVLNGLVHLPFMEQSIINIGDIKMKIWNWSDNRIQAGLAV